MGWSLFNKKFDYENYNGKTVFEDPLCWFGNDKVWTELSDDEKKTSTIGIGRILSMYQNMPILRKKKNLKFDNTNIINIDDIIYDTFPKDIENIDVYSSGSQSKIPCVESKVATLNAHRLNYPDNIKIPGSGIKYEYFKISMDIDKLRSINWMYNGIPKKYKNSVSIDFIYAMIYAKETKETSDTESKWFPYAYHHIIVKILPNGKGTFHFGIHKPEFRPDSVIVRF